MHKWKLFLLVFFLNSVDLLAWGFAAHKQINRYAVFTLPPGMFKFYKYYLTYITENAVNPDKRRYVMEAEAARHYVDLDYYPDSVIWKKFQHWQEAIKIYPAPILQAHGILPWHICHVKQALTAAFAQKDLIGILKLSTDIGHYLADANVPLHTTQNYNGQLTGQEGIHGLWETRIPELFSENYNFFVGQATYLHNPQQKAWEAIWQAHTEVERVLSFEQTLAAIFPVWKQYSFEWQGTSLRKVYARAYVQAYHTLLAGQVERQMQASIKLVGDFWLTCWMDAGKPNLGEISNLPIAESELQEGFAEQKQLQVRDCGD